MKVRKWMNEISFNSISLFIFKIFTCINYRFPLNTEISTNHGFLLHTEISTNHRFPLPTEINITHPLCFSNFDLSYIIYIRNTLISVSLYFSNLFRISLSIIIHLLMYSLLFILYLYSFLLHILLPGDNLYLKLYFFHYHTTIGSYLFA